MPSQARLFQPIALRGTTLKNRIVVSPMCQYAVRDGMAGEWHKVHLGRFAMGGAGAVFVEATAVEPRGRITHGDLGIWSDDHGKALAGLVQCIRSLGAEPAIQLGHAGRKGSMQRPWFGNGPLGQADIARGDRPWDVIAPSAERIGEDWLLPHALSAAELDALLENFRSAAARAVRAGFGLLELHMAHGYLLHQFLSAQSNKRGDAYGGDLAGRMRFPLLVVKAVREAAGEAVPVFVRISAQEPADPAWSMADNLALAAELKAAGIDAIDCSTGGLGGSATAQPLPRRRGFQVPFAAEIRKQAGIATMAVGLILDGPQAEAILADSSADLIAVGREFLRDPNWGLNAALALETEGWDAWPEQSGWWLRRRRVDAG